MRPTALLMVVTLASAANASVAWKPIYGVRGGSMGGATAATSPDSASALVNPALLVESSGSSASIGVLAFYRPGEISFRRQADEMSPDGYAETSTSSLSGIPYAGVLYSPRDEKPFAFGLSVAVPFADALDWPADSPGRYWGTKTEFSFTYVTPALAWRVNPKVALGVGFSYVKFQGHVQQKLDLGALVGSPETPELDGDADLRGSGNGYAYNVGILLQPTDRFDIGCSYLSGVSLTADGSRDVSIPEVIQSALGLPDRISFTRERLEVRLPSVMRLGTAFRAADNLLLAGEIQWIDRSRQKLRLLNHGSTHPEVVPDSEEDLVPVAFSSAFSYKVGAEYTRRTWSYRLGAVYDESGVPEASMSPGGLDADKIELTAGIGKRWDLFTVDLGYARVLGQDQKVDGSQVTNRFTSRPANGDYGLRSHIIMLGFGFNF